MPYLAKSHLVSVIKSYCVANSNIAYCKTTLVHILLAFMLYKHMQLFDNTYLLWESPLDGATDLIVYKIQVAQAN